MLAMVPIFGCPTVLRLFAAAAMGGVNLVQSLQLRLRSANQINCSFKPLLASVQLDAAF